MLVKSYTQEQWLKLVETPIGIQKIMLDCQAYADKKGVLYQHIGMRWVGDKIFFYVKPEKHRHETMNFD